MGSPISRTWPALFGLRRQLLPFADRAWDFVVRPCYRRELACVWHVDPATATDRLLTHPDVYPNNLASLKYVERDGERVYEYSSVAHRPEGIFGEWQTHYRLLPHPDGTVVYAHDERNALRSPLDHVRGNGWNAHTGRQQARKFLEELSADITPRRELVSR